MRLPTTCLLALLTLSAPAGADPLLAEAPPRLERVLEALQPLDESWRAAVGTAPEAQRLSPTLAAPLAGALLELEACGCVHDGRSAAAGLASTVLRTARAAGAEPRALLALELALRERLVLLIEDRVPPAGAPAGWTRAEASRLLEAAAGSSRAELRAVVRELRPGWTAGLSDQTVDGLAARALRELRGDALPVRVASRLDAALLAGRPEARR